MSDRTVLVAMSGGVDSSVAACLLAQQGFDVVGVHMRLMHLEGLDHGCCGPRARVDAEAVARVAGIRFEVVDLTQPFADEVVADFVEEHRNGRTPNPCARCNGQIKFGAFVRLAEERDVDRIATGHYVRTARAADGRWKLLRGIDGSKDQSYMLHTIGQRALQRALFPVGVLSKAETRRLAATFALPVASKPDSQELCFAPAGDVDRFVRQSVPELVRSGGELVDDAGRAIGVHDGTFSFTVGQRRGLGVATGEPQYVQRIDAGANRVVVGPRELLARRRLVADRVTWVAGHPPDDKPFEAHVRLRYRGEDVAAVVEPGGDEMRVELRTAQHAVAPGQSVVVYRGDEVMGGGRIVETAR